MIAKLGNMHMIKLNRIQKIGVTGVFLFALGIFFMTYVVPHGRHSMMRKKLALKQGWRMRYIWGKFPFSTDFSFYVFNVTNPEDIHKGAKPILQEIGPYVYNEWQEKSNQVDNDEDDTVSFNFRSSYFFDAKKSHPLTGLEEVIVPNFVGICLINIVLRDRENIVPIVGKAIDSIYSMPDTLFMKVRVKDLLFDGMFLNCTAKDFAGSAVCLEVKNNYKEFGFTLLADNQYLLSLFNSRNGTDSHNRLSINRGIKNLSKLGQTVAMDGKPNMTIWKDKYCDQIDGTDGMIFPPRFDKKGKDSILYFSSDFCRTFTGTFVSPSKTFGLNTLRYTIDVGTDPEGDPRDTCYCIKPNRCLKKGAFDVYKCTELPILLSNPHFYLADPYYLNQVKGLNPNKDQHAVAIHIEPFSGVPLESHMRVQFNLAIMPLEKVRLMKNFPEALLPVLWMDQHLALPDFLVNELKLLLRYYSIGLTLQYVWMIAGLGMCGFAGYKHYMSVREKRQDSRKTVLSKPSSQASSADNKMNSSTLPSASIPPNVE